MKTQPPAFTNAHVAHPERDVRKCPWPKCGQTHMPHTKLAKDHEKWAAKARFRGLL